MCLLSPALSSNGGEGEVTAGWCAGFSALEVGAKNKSESAEIKFKNAIEYLPEKAGPHDIF